MHSSRESTERRKSGNSSSLNASTLLTYVPPDERSNHERKEQAEKVEQRPGRLARRRREYRIEPVAHHVH